jgi:uncharacterized metal-binding protein
MEFEGRCCKRSIDAVLVEIGGIDSLGVQQEVLYGLLLSLLQHLPSDAERRPLKRKKKRRVRRAKACHKQH